jgi:hypothetical protein
MFSTITNIKDMVILGLIATGLFLGYLKYRDVQEIARLENNLTATTEQYQLANNKWVTETTELRFTNDELKNISKLDSSKLSDLQKKLLKANEAIDELNIKAKDVENINIIDLNVSNDDLVSDIVYDEDNALKEIEPIKTDHLSIEFEVKGDKILVSHEYTSEITTVVSRSADRLTNSGKKRIFIARWINPRWKYSAKNISNDPNAKIESAISINFQRNKGSR